MQISHKSEIEGIDRKYNGALRAHVYANARRPGWPNAAMRRNKIAINKGILYIFI